MEKLRRMFLNNKIFMWAILIILGWTYIKAVYYNALLLFVLKHYLETFGDYDHFSAQVSAISTEITANSTIVLMMSAVMIGALVTVRWYYKEQ